MKLIGKLAIVAASLAVSGVSAAVVAVKKTEKGAAAWKTTQEFATKQYDAFQGACTKASVKIVDKYETVKGTSEAKGEAKAMVDFLAKNEGMRKQVLEQMKAAQPVIVAE